MALSGFTDYYEDQIINHMLRAQAFSPAATVYVGLYTTMPDDDGTGGVEVSGNAYARQAVTLAAASGGASSNSVVVTFPVATPATWGTVVGFGLFDALTVGNLLMGGTLTVPKAVAASDQLTFLVGDLDVSVT